LRTLLSPPDLSSVTRIAGKSDDQIRAMIADLER
jgi:hypothetical protein